jgi:hypothetical protein
MFFRDAFGFEVGVDGLAAEGACFEETLERVRAA